MKRSSAGFPLGLPVEAQKAWKQTSRSFFLLSFLVITQGNQSSAIPPTVGSSVHRCLPPRCCETFLVLTSPGSLLSVAVYSLGSSALDFFFSVLLIRRACLSAVSK